MKHGFTLIELLVVVLIIGVLAAIALPQYQLAVHKARLAEGVMFVRAVKDAERVYYLANGEFTTNFSALDVQPPAVGQYFTFVVHLQDAAPGGATSHVEASYGKSGVAMWVIAYLYPDRDFIACVAPKGATLANRICKSMGVLTSEDPEGHGANNYYAI